MIQMRRPFRLVPVLAVCLAVSGGCGALRRDFVATPLTETVHRYQSAVERDRTAADGASSPATTRSAVASPIDPAVSRTAAELAQVAEPAADAPAPGPSEAAPTSPPDAPAPPDVVPPAIPPAPSHYPIDLPTALRLAESENPTIGEARANVAVSLVQLQQARLELVPNLNGGFNYDGHTGPLQRSSGEILRVSRQALYIGGGAQAEAAGPAAVPAVFLLNHLSDSLFDPLAARQRVDQARFEATSTANATLLEVAEAFLELQGAQILLEARRRTEADAAEVARITAEYARAGQGSQADAQRGETQRRLRRAEVHQAEEAVAVASARLARRLHLDPSVALRTVGDPLVLYDLIDLETPVDQLVGSAVLRRPEVAAGSAGLAVAETRKRQEVARPFLPTLYLGFSGAVFGGGSNIVPPTVGNFRGRTDFDVFAYWSLLNFGLGNAARIRERQAQLGEAFGARQLVMARVRDEVASARGEALSQAERIQIARRELADAQDAFNKDLERTIQAVQEVRPIELTNSLDQLREAREQYIESIIGYDQAQFRLFVALGSPPPLQGPTAPAPAPVLASAEELTTNPAAPAPPTTDAPPPPAAPRPASADPAPTPVIEAEPAQALLADLDAAHSESLKAARDYEAARARLQQAVESGADALPTAAEAVESAHAALLAAEARYALRPGPHRARQAIPP